MNLITNINFSQLAPSFLSNFITEMSETNKKIAVVATAVFALFAVCALAYRCKNSSAKKLDGVDKGEKKDDVKDVKKDDVKEEKKVEQNPPKLRKFFVE